MKKIIKGTVGVVLSFLLAKCDEPAPTPACAPVAETPRKEMLYGEDYATAPPGWIVDVVMPSQDIDADYYRMQELCNEIGGDGLVWNQSTLQLKCTNVWRS